MGIDAVNLARIDLNLLVHLDALLRNRSVTRAAAQVGIGQSAMSHNLARLRERSPTNCSRADPRACA